MLRPAGVGRTPGPVDGALTVLRDVVGCTYFDWLSAVDELEPGLRRGVPRRAVRTAAAGRRDRPPAGAHALPRDAARLPHAAEVYAGAGWSERETYEMFGIDFAGHPNLRAFAAA